MAVDYLHRLVVEGSYERIRTFRRRMHREYPRSVGPETWTEVVPFSFEPLYQLAPSARRVEREVPLDPYELRAWPVKRIGKRRAEVRYQFQTRNLEMVGLTKALSRALPTLTFTLMTFCFDDSGMESYRLSRGMMKKWVLSHEQQEAYWEQARKKFRLEGDEIYNDDDAEFWAEEQMRNEAVRHWDRASTRQRHRYSWWNREPLRDLQMERQLALYEVAEALARDLPTTNRGTKTRRGRTHKRR